MLLFFNLFIYLYLQELYLPCFTVLWMFEPLEFEAIYKNMFVSMFERRGGKEVRKEDDGRKAHGKKDKKHGKKK